MGNDLYNQVVAYDHGDAERNALTRKVWSGTPYMIDTYTGSTGERRDLEMRWWCRDRWGREAAPLHGIAGEWLRGGATIHGWTWYGFRTQAQLNEFMAAWPDPEAAVA